MVKHLFLIINKMENKQFNEKMMSVLSKDKEIHEGTLFTVWELWRMHFGEHTSCCPYINKFYEEIQNEAIPNTK